MTMKDAAAIVGVGATQYYPRGKSYPEESELSLCCKSILAALDDAGLTVADVDGFALYAQAFEPAEVAAALGVPEVRFTATTTGGGGASGASVGLAAAAIHAGMATCVVTAYPVQQANRRLGGSAVPTEGGGSQLTYGDAALGVASPYTAFTANDGLLGPGHIGGVDRAAAHAQVRHPARTLRRGRHLDTRQRHPAPEGDLKSR